MDKLSQFFTKTTRESPQDEEAINACLLIRAGYIAKQMAGVYTLLPLGLRVVNRINQIIREELNQIGAEELLMPTFQPKQLWEKTGRWQTENKVMYQFVDNSGREIGLGWTHEEVVTNIATQFIHSYKDLPKAVYQIQTKFRDEPRAKSGILRGREFMMKDLYSFHIDQADRDSYYEKVKLAYRRIFDRIGINTIVTEASGGAFSKFSHEFQVVSESGEDTIWLCQNCHLAVNDEIMTNLGKKCQQCQAELVAKTAIEVGNIFKLGTKFSEALGLIVANSAGERVPVEMSSFGIGPTRVMGTIVETSHDDKGIIWTKNTAPYDCHIVTINNQDTSGNNKINQIVDRLEKLGLDILLDDREDVSVGEKLADADLIGVPWRIVISQKSIEQGGVELKSRVDEQPKIVAVDKLLDTLSTIL